MRSTRFPGLHLGLDYHRRWVKNVT